MKKKTAWEKLKTGQQPKIVADYKDGPMLVSTPEEVESCIAKIPRGKVLTTTDLRAQLAASHGVAICCPMSTGIFVNIVARAHHEREATTGQPGVPWWRVVKPGPKLNEKFPGGTAEQRRRLAAEGILIDEAL